jgi:hypothetical protein
MMCVFANSGTFCNGSYFLLDTQGCIHFLSAKWQNTLSRQILQIIAQMPVLSVILLHQKHTTKAGAAIAMTEIIQFGEIQFFYMTL